MSLVLLGIYFCTVTSRHRITETIRQKFPTHTLWEVIYISNRFRIPVWMQYREGYFYYIALRIFYFPKLNQKLHGNWKEVPFYSLWRWEMESSPWDTLTASNQPPVILAPLPAPCFSTISLHLSLWIQPRPSKDQALSCNSTSAHTLSSSLESFCPSLPWRTVASILTLNVHFLGKGTSLKHRYMCAKSLQFCLSLCKAMDCSPPVSSVHGILQQEYWSGFPCPPPGDLPNPEVECLLHCRQSLYRLRHQGSPQDIPQWPPQTLTTPNEVPYFHSLRASYPSAQ